MNILFKTSKLLKTCTDDRLRQKEQGQVRAKKIKLRLDDMHAASVLEELRYLPGRCHELTGDRKGELAVDLDHPFRLIFRIANDPVPHKEDGGLDWNKVTAIEIQEIVDYHD
jgi:proteic killer suppression protein